MKAGDHEYYSNYFSGFNAKRKPILTQDSPSSGDSDENDADEEEEEENDERSHQTNGTETMQMSSTPNISFQQHSVVSPTNVLHSSNNKPSFIRSAHNQ